MARRAQPGDGYPLRTVTARTGLSADLIRAWEKRYQVVAPVRGPRGARLYNADDIARLRLLGRVVESGRTIGDVARLESRQLARLAGEVPAGEHLPSGSVREVLEAAGRFDAARVESLLGEALVGYGCAVFVQRVAVPLVVEVGQRWEAGQLSIAEEHLVSAVLRNLIVSLMQRRAAAAVSPLILLGTPSGDRHEMGLLLVALLALDAGVGVSYLGVDLPAAEITTAARRSGAAVVGISVVNGENRRRAVEEIRALEQGLPSGAVLWLGGRDAAGTAAALREFGGLVIDDLDRAKDELSRLRRAAAR